MREQWDAHWRGRPGLKDDLSGEPLWPTIEDRLHKPGRVLEAGCGTGQWVHYLGRLGHDVVGVDYAAGGLEVGLRHNPDLELIQADFTSLPFADSTFDYVVSFGAIEHDVNGPEKALVEFHRTLRPDGILMCSVPCLNPYRMLLLPWFAMRDWLKRRELLRRMWKKTTPFVFYEYMWTPGTYATLLANAGFEVIEFRGYGRALKGRLVRVCDRLLNRVYPLSNSHMMMAICRKQV